MIKTIKKKQRRIAQGDIIKNVEHIEYINEKNGNIFVSKIIFPFVIVLTQDCDLNQDYKYRFEQENRTSEDKFLLSVLVAPLYNAEHIYTGEHLSDLEMRMTPINRRKSPGDNLRKNETPRYHYLEFSEDIPVVNSVIDFKHYFSVNVAYINKLKRNKFICQVSPLFREDISQRFSSYLARIGLP